MPEVKNRCKKCGYSETYTKKEKILRVIYVLISTFLMLLGIVLILYICQIGLQPFFNSFASAHYTYISIKEADSVREEAITIIKNCDPLDQICYTQSLYNEFSNMKYIPDPLIIGGRHRPPAYVRNWSTDCDGLAQMYVSYAQSIGLDSLVNCSSTHCVSLVYIDNDIYKIDLTAPEIIKIKR